MTAAANERPTAGDVVTTGRDMPDDGDQRPPILWVGGVGWEGTSSTELHLITEIARIRPVVWFAPPARGAWRGWFSSSTPAVERRGDLTLVRVPALPGITRWPVRLITEMLLKLTVIRCARASGASSLVLASPVARFPDGVTAPRVMFITDDWRSGADLMGFRRGLVQRRFSRNAAASAGIAAVSEPLVSAGVQARGAARAPLTRLVPNGARPARTGSPLPTAALAVYVGQINERIDLGLLEAVVDAGIALRVVGPVTARSAEFRGRATELAGHRLVEWFGLVEADVVPDLVSSASVGLTPYARSDFNLASSPLKTYEYLACGIPVVSTDLPASRSLDSDMVAVEVSTEGFVRAVAEAIAARDAADRRDRCLDLAQRNAWSVRASEFVDFLDEIGAEAE